MALTINHRARDAASLEELSALFRALGQCRRASDSDSRLLDFGRRFGFRSGVYLIVPRNHQRKPHLKRIAGTLDGFWSGYLNGRLYQFDPVLRAVRSQRTGVVWSDIARDVRSSSKADLFFRYGELHDISDGLSIPIRHSGGRLTIVSLVGRPPALPRTTRQMLMLAVVAAFAHQFKLRSNVRQARLTERETEISRWIASGKSDWEISQILGISAKTVNFHVENVKRKYGVSTRIQAIVAGMRDGAFEL